MCQHCSNQAYIAIILTQQTRSKMMACKLPCEQHTALKKTLVKAQEIIIHTDVKPYITTTAKYCAKSNKTRSFAKVQKQCGAKPRHAILSRLRDHPGLMKPYKISQYQVKSNSRAKCQLSLLDFFVLGLCRALISL